MMIVVHNSELKTTAIYTLGELHVSSKLVLNRLVWEEGKETRKDRGRQVLPAEQKSVASWESEKGICVVAPRERVREWGWISQLGAAG